MEGRNAIDCLQRNETFMVQFHIEEFSEADMCRMNNQNF